jgi:hypothetical protein
MTSLVSAITVSQAQCHCASRHRLLQTRSSARQNLPPAILITVWARAEFVPFQPSLNSSARGELDAIAGTIQRPHKRFHRVRSAGTALRGVIAWWPAAAFWWDSPRADF